MGEESPGIWVELWNSLLSEIMAKLMKMREKADIEGEGVDVIFGAPALAISGFELQGFVFSEIVRRKKTGGTVFVWVCFWHRSTSAMWIFKSSYLISFWFAGIIWCTHIFHKLVISAHLFMKMTSWGYCVVRPDISGTFRIDSVVIRVWNCCSHFGGGCPERGF